MHSTQRWSQRLFGGSNLGDARRTARLVQMARRAAQRPSGKVSKVFRNAAERQGAYDLLEHERVDPEAITRALAQSTARACAKEERVLVAVDGSSLTFTDGQQKKGLGRIGSFKAGASGLKVMNALAMTTEGEPIGVAEQSWWTRDQRAPRKGYRRPDDRESVYWRTTVEKVANHYATLAPHTTLHFLADREADATLLIQQLLREGHEFTIRSNANRKVLGSHGRASIRRSLAQRKPVAKMTVAIPSNGRRKPRLATLDVRAAQLDVRMRDGHLRDTRVVPLTLVWAREPKPGGLDWILVTNTPVHTAQQACDTVRRYTFRWRIEDFHRTWKSGLCHVEDAQLRSKNALVKWATVLAAVASRAEMFRHRARTQPDEPVHTLLSEDEIEALVILKGNIKRRNERVSKDGLTVGTAVRWIADLGGYVGNKNSGPPGATTIGRGLLELDIAAQLLDNLRAQGKLR